MNDARPQLAVIVTMDGDRSAEVTIFDPPEIDGGLELLGMVEVGRMAVLKYLYGDEGVKDVEQA